MLNIIYNSFITCCLYTLFTTIALGQEWKQYAHVEDVGFSSEALDQVTHQMDSLGTAALMVVYKGNVLLSYGETSRKFMLHSIRKSLLNAMIGIEVDKGIIDLEQSLADLHIDDLATLSDEEKKATVMDLLSARSGIYLPSAYAPEWMLTKLPKRGSHKPGSFWFYNNWDFNALLTIYEQQSHKRFFEAFKAEIADPIGMEDFDLGNTYYRYEKDKSVHPAYLFRMSARDMARYGLLYLNHGVWDGQSLIPSTWIEKSLQPVSTDLAGFGSREAYGWLWWVSSITGRPVCYASGAGGQRIMLFPEDDLVIVHLANTYENFKVSDGSVDDLAAQILAAKQESAFKPDAELTPYLPSKTVYSATYSGSMDDTYIGTYNHRFFGEMTIKQSEDGYILETNVGVFRLFPTSENSFLTEDIDIPLLMKKETEAHKAQTIEAVMQNRTSIKEMVFYY